MVHASDSLFLNPEKAVHVGLGEFSRAHHAEQIYSELQKRATADKF